MEREGEAEFKKVVMKNNDTYSNIVKPLVKGCLTGEYQALIVYCNRSIKIHPDRSVYSWGGSSFKQLPDLEMIKTRCKQMLRFDLLCGVTHAPLSLGLFDGASIISGFSAAACNHPWIYLKEIKDAVMRKYLAGEKHAYRNIPLYVTRILTPHGGCKFYLQCWIYEKIRFEE
ncbi:hypothetical protein OROGR_022263 [Orobanche gracilis]